MLIDTVVSRCSTVYFPKINSKDIEKYLDSNKIENSKYIAKISSGNIKTAINLTNSYKDKITLIKNFTKLIVNIETNDFNSISSFMKTKNETIENLILVNLFIKDLLVIQKTNKNIIINFLELHSLLSNLNLNNPKVNWNDCIDLINNAQNFILKNGMIDLIIVSLIIELRKVLSLKFYNVNFIEEYLNYQT